MTYFAIVRDEDEPHIHYNLTFNDIVKFKNDGYFIIKDFDWSFTEFPTNSIFIATGPILI